jgi:hypothetical protein
MLSRYAVCYHAECRVLLMIMLNVTLLSVAMLNVVVLSVVAPSKMLKLSYFCQCVYFCQQNFVLTKFGHNLIF